MIRIAILCAALALSSVASSHDFWTNGEEVPQWVRASCCGKSDAHHLRMSAVHIMADGVHIDGINTVVPVNRILPSPDGTAWAFWNEANEPEPAIFCLFLPFSGL